MDDRSQLLLKLSELAVGEQMPWVDAAAQVDNAISATEWLRNQGYVDVIGFREPRDWRDVRLALTEAGRRRVELATYSTECRVLGHVVEEPYLLRLALDVLHQHIIEVHDQLASVVADEFNLPSRLLRLAYTAKSLSHELEKQHVCSEPLDRKSVVEVLVLACRLNRVKVRNRLERLEALSTTPELEEGARVELSQLNRVLRWPDVAACRATPMPRVTDYISVGHAHVALNWTRDPGPLVPDEKFGVLSEPKSFVRDFDWASGHAFARGRSLAVAYIDIDYFKQLNNRHSETWVDRRVLPMFMRALEAFCFGRAYAYREGGDEYIVLSPNSDVEDARYFFERLRGHLGSLEFDRNERVTVSIGVHVVSPDAVVTVSEAKQLANRAKIGPRLTETVSC